MKQSKPGKKKQEIKEFIKKTAGIFKFKKPVKIKKVYKAKLYD